MSTTALAAIDRRIAADGVPPQWADGLKAEMGERISLVATSDTDLTPKLEWVTRMRHDVIQAERLELIRLWRENLISDDVMHHLMETLDYEQAKLPAANSSVRVPVREIGEQTMG